MPLLTFGQVDVIRDTTKQYVEHSAYSFVYNEEREQADWVLHLNTIEHLTNPVIKRKNSFRYDKAVTTKSAGSADYKKSGFDRGHLAPAANMLWDTLAMQESFFMSNMSPQRPGFNRGIWKSLEAYVRKYALSEDSVYVYSGPIYEGVIETIGVNEVAVPSHYFKIVWTYKTGIYKVHCWVLPNHKTDKSLDSFLVPIQVVEHMSGLDFYLK